MLRISLNVALYDYQQDLTATLIPIFEYSPNSF